MPTSWKWVELLRFLIAKGGFILLLNLGEVNRKRGQAKTILRILLCECQIWPAFPYKRLNRTCISFSKLSFFLLCFPLRNKPITKRASIFAFSVKQAEAKGLYFPEEQHHLPGNK